MISVDDVPVIVETRRRPLAPGVLPPGCDAHTFDEVACDALVSDWSPFDGHDMREMGRPL